VERSGEDFPESGREFGKNYIHDKILPILEDQPGFVEEILLVSDTDPDQILALSFWEGHPYDAAGRETSMSCIRPISEGGNEPRPSRRPIAPR